MWILLLLAGFAALGLRPHGDDRAPVLLFWFVVVVVGYRAVSRHLL